MDTTNAMRYGGDNIEQFRNIILLMKPEVLTDKWRWRLTMSNHICLDYRGKYRTLMIDFGNRENIVITVKDNFTDDIILTDSLQAPEICNDLDKLKSDFNQYIKVYMETLNVEWVKRE